MLSFAISHPLLFLLLVVMPALKSFLSLSFKTSSLVFPLDCKLVKCRLYGPGSLYLTLTAHTVISPVPFVLYQVFGWKLARAFVVSKILLETASSSLLFHVVPGSSRKIQ